MKPEAQAEVILWDWLRNVGEVYFNRKNAIGCATFRVEGESTEIPDLLLKCVLYGREEVFAIEVKDGDKSSNIVSGKKIFNKYLLNYIDGKTKYFVGDEEIKITRFLVASQYSPEGHLFGRGDSIHSSKYTSQTKWINKIVPRLEFIRTKDFGRNIIFDYSDYRKQNKYKEGVGLGWLISDVVLKFDKNELESQSGIKGHPYIQGVGWNDKIKKWGQFFTPL